MTRRVFKNIKKSHPIYFLQAIPLYLSYAVFWCLPLDWASALGGWIGRSVGPHLGASRKARRNLELALPEMKDQHNDFITEMWGNLGRMLGEAPHLKKFIHSGRIVVRGYEEVEKLKDQNHSAIIFSSHSANWEMSPVVFKENSLPFSIIYRPPNNVYVERLLLFARRYIGTNLIPKGREAARGILKRLTNKEYIGWLVDQKESAGIKANFFDHPCNTSTAPADIALKTGAKLVPVTMKRTKGAYFEITIHPPLETDGLDSNTLTQKINDTLEDHIRSNPGQWLWLHRRWKSVIG